MASLSKVRPTPFDLGPVHFVGIGGIGMSGIAEIMLKIGYQVQGSDAKASANTERLEKAGAKIFIGHATEHLTDGVCALVYSTAVKSDNPEMVEARRRRIPLVRRAEMLAELMRLQFSIAVGGTHGKTTTTSMVAAVLDAGGLDPTVVNGGIINAYGTNAKVGDGDWIVVEADESDGSFLRLKSTLAIVTNIDPEHLDHWGDFEAVKKGFVDFVENIPFYGFAAVCIDHPEVQALTAKVENRRLIPYGVSPQAEVRCANIEFGPEGAVFDVVFSPTGVEPFTWEKIKLPMTGNHNVSNATAAIALARELGIGGDAVRKGLGAFGGVKRRFTTTGIVDGVRIVDDYGHHPVEIAAVLKAARQVSTGRVIAVVQPHRYTRLRDLMTEFSTCFNDADTVIVADVYSAGEQPIDGIDKAHLVDGLHRFGHRNAIALEGPAQLASVVAGEAKSGDIVVLLGAGDITQWAYALPAAVGSAEVSRWVDKLPPVRGRIMTDTSLAPFTWFRVGGPAEVIFLPEDEADLCKFLKALDRAVPVLTIGVGSNLLVRDRGIDGVVIRLGKSFATVEAREGARIYAGAAALDAQVAKVAAQAGIAGLEFYRGVPGTIGGAIVMNAGCYGAETKDILIEAYAVTRAGEQVTLSNAEMGYAYRHSEPEGLIYTGALYQGTPDDATAVTERMDAITARREQTQPIREKTGGSTFKNPDRKSAWQCVDEAGWRGRMFGGAKFSELHSNFMINANDATAADLEGLGEAVRADVKTKLGIDLHWEIKRIGKT